MQFIYLYYLHCNGNEILFLLKNYAVPIPHSHRMGK